MREEQPKRILIIDDEPYMVMLLRGRLEYLGYEIDEAFTAAEAYERMKKSRYDLLLLDFFLPDERGDEVCRSIRRNPLYAKTPIIMVTGFSTRDSEDFVVSGATEVLFKPVSQERLQQAVVRCLV